MKPEANLMYNALMAQCEAEKAEALFTIDNYMNNSVGIGEHPQQVEETDFASLPLEALMSELIVSIILIVILTFLIAQKLSQ